MSAALCMAIWIASSSVFEAALPFSGTYVVKQFPNSDPGLEEFMAWVQSSGHDKIQLICVAIKEAQDSPAAQFWREMQGMNVLFMNPIQVDLYAEKHAIRAITAQTVAEVCGEMFPGKR